MFRAFTRADSPSPEDNTPVMVESGRDGPTADAVASATEELPKRKRGRPRGTGAKAASASATAAEDETAVMLDDLFKPELWGPLAAMPADAMLAMTGHAFWNLGKEERETLGTTATTAARFMGIQNPKALAISLLLVNLAMVYAPRAIKEFALMKEEREKKARENKHGS